MFESQTPPTERMSSGQPRRGCGGVRLRVALRLVEGVGTPEMISAEQQTELIYLNRKFQVYQRASA